MQNKTGSLQSCKHTACPAGPGSGNKHPSVPARYLRLLHLRWFLAVCCQAAAPWHRKQKLHPEGVTHMICLAMCTIASLRSLSVLRRHSACKQICWPWFRARFLGVSRDCIEPKPQQRKFFVVRFSHCIQISGPSSSHCLIQVRMVGALEPTRFGMLLKEPWLHSAFN